MSKFTKNLSFILLVYVFQITITIANHRFNDRYVKTNNDDLQKCLSSFLPPSTRTVYPCDTLTNQNSSQYPCDNFTVTGLSCIHGGRIPHSPAVIVFVKNSSDIQNVIKCAKKLNYIVNAISGGHSYEGYGLGSTYNNIIINMEAINHIHINQYDGTGIFGAGARLGPIYYRTYQYNYTVNAGSCVWVGLAGHVLGGGQGYLSRLYGLLSDNILEMKAINAEGELIIINKTHESELFWGLRGAGGGLFVIVTEFKFRLIKPPPLVRKFSSIWFGNATKLVIQRYQALLFDEKLSNFSNHILLSMAVYKTQVEISVVYFGIEFEEFNKTKSSLLTTLPAPNRTQLYEQDWLTFVYEASGIDNPTGNLQQLLLENLTYPTFYFKAKHLYYNQPINSYSLDQLIHQLALGDGQLVLGFSPWDGYLSTIPVDETAFPHRNFKLGIQMMVYSNDKQHEKQQMNWLNQRYTKLDEDVLSHTSSTIN